MCNIANYKRYFTRYFDYLRYYAKIVQIQAQQTIPKYLSAQVHDYFVYKTILPGTPFNISNLNLVFHVPCDLSIFP